MPEKIFIIDGSGYIFRAFYAIQRLSTRDGFPTNALFGFTRMIMKTIALSKSSHISIIFDAGRKTFRNDLYPEYKANRAECPADLVKQMPYFREISKLLGLHVFEMPGFEADDIIGTISETLSKQGKQVVIVSGDKDILQLVNPNVSVWDTMKDQKYGAKEVEAKLGVKPEQVIDYLGLVGDSSDNVPGLSGCGPKTALQLIAKFGTVENVLEKVEEIKNDPEIRSRNKIAEALVNGKELLLLSKKLVTIDLNVPLTDLVQEKGSLENALAREEVDREKITELFNRFEFDALIGELGSIRSAGVQDQEPAGNYVTVDSKAFPEFTERLKTQDLFAVDLETTSLNIEEAEIVGASFCWADDTAYYVPLLHKESSVEQVSKEDFVKALAPILAHPDSTKIGHNLKYDIGVLENHGLAVSGTIFDTMVACYLLDPDARSFNLTVAADQHLGKQVIEYTEVTEGLADFSYVSVEKATRYAGQDAHYAWLLKAKLEPLLTDAKLARVSEEIEMPLVPVISRMERRGIKVDKELLEKMSAEFALQLKNLEGQIFNLAGSEFNVNSPKQLSEVLFTKLGIATKGIKKTKLGYSTDSSVLEKLEGTHPVAGLLLEYRMLHKLKSTYTDSLSTYISPKDGRVHTRLNQTGTGTGRFSSSDPNLQNIPIQTPQGRRVRSAFVAEPGKVLIAADYSQIELRLLAHLSGDTNMIGAFASDLDIHTQTAREILGLSMDQEVPKEARRLGKTINFGIVYGMGPYRLARDLKIPVAAATEYIASYFRRYPKVREYFDLLEEQIRTEGEVRTLFGRRRVTGSIDTAGRDEGFAIRAGLNAPLQGSAADVIKLAMLRVEEYLASTNLGILILQIHDELLIETDERSAPELSKKIQSIMEAVTELDVPLKVDVGVAKNWEEA